MGWAVCIICRNAQLDLTLFLTFSFLCRTIDELGVQRAIILSEYFALKNGFRYMDI